MEINMAIDKVREYFKTYQMDDHILELKLYFRLQEVLTVQLN